MVVYKGRGKGHHKGRRRHFTDAEELRMEMEKEKRQQDWRVKWLYLTLYLIKSVKQLQ